MKWQTILILLTTLLIPTFAGIANLTGVEVSFSGNTVVDYNSDGYGYLNYTSTYWAICFEHSGDKDSVYKKQTRSRTLWFNLDKFVFTNPNIETSFQTAARGKDNWRDVKDGDCIKRKTKSRPQPNRFRLVGHNLKETTKWGFDAEYFLMKDIKIDPLWIVKENDLKIIEECNTKFWNETRQNMTTTQYYIPSNDSWANNHTWTPYQIERNETICKTTLYKYKGQVINASEWCCNPDTLFCDSINRDGNGDCIIQSGEDYIDLENKEFRIDDKKAKEHYKKEKEKLKDK